MANEKRLIDANALIRRLGKRRENLASAWKTFDAMPNDAKIQYHENLECSLIVEDMPIVDDVEVKRGRWETVTQKTVSRLSKCSACGFEKYNIHWCNYCPNCGAKMRGGEQ